MPARLLPRKPESLQHLQKNMNTWKAQSVELGVPQPKSGMPYFGGPQPEAAKRQRKEEIAFLLCVDTFRVL